METEFAKLWISEHLETLKNKYDVGKAAIVNIAISGQSGTGIYSKRRHNYIA